MKKSESDKIEKYLKDGKRFIGYYSSYVTSLSGESPVDAIKDFYSRYNAVLDLLYDDKTGTIYIGKENDEPDVRGYFNYSYYNKKTKELLFNLDELTKPIVKLTPVKNDGTIEHAYIDRSGNIFKCGFQCHTHLADELFLSKTVKLPEQYKDERNMDEVLDNMGWLKISSKRINFIVEKLSQEQKNFIKKYIEIIDNETYEFRWGRLSKDEILMRLNEY